MRKNRQTLVLVNFFRKSPFQIKGQFGPNLPQNYSTLYLMICHRFCLKHFSIMRHNIQIKVTLVSFPRNSLLVQLGNLGQNYATLCLRQLGLMKCSLRSLKNSVMMRFNIQTKVMFFSLPKKSPSTQGQLIPFGRKLSNLIFHDSLSENCFGILWHFGTQYIDKSNVSQFYFWSNMSPVWPKITLLTALEIFRNIFLE